MTSGVCCYDPAAPLPAALLMYNPANRLCLAEGIVVAAYCGSDARHTTLSGGTFP